MFYIIVLRVYSFWINHDLIKVRPLVPVLRDIKQFLLKAKGEIVILDLHRFPVGFSGRHSRHTILVEMLQRELQDVLIRYEGSWPTLDKLWQQQKQLILVYGDKDVASSKRPSSSSSLFSPPSPTYYFQGTLSLAVCSVRPVQLLVSRHQTNWLSNVSCLAEGIILLFLLSTYWCPFWLRHLPISTFESSGIFLFLCHSL